MRVQEKLEPRLWAYHGLFQLVEAWQENRDGLRVFEFRAVAAVDAAMSLSE